MSQYPAPPPNFDIERFFTHYRTMSRIRAFEEAALRGAREGLVKGAIHPSIGQEAIASGVCGNLLASDAMLSTHRGHGHTLAKGADPRAMMRELFGKAGGNCGGKGGSMHIADFSVGMLGANGVVGANILIAAGAAHAIALRGERRAVVCLFGDGAVNRGPFLEGLNWASTFGLPVLYVCESNGFAATTRTDALTAGPGPLQRAQSLGMEAASVDGNDILALDEIVREWLPAVRERGARFLLANTYRLTGHTAADPAAYRPESEVKERWRNDPIGRCAALLEAAGVPPARLEALRNAADEEMAAALAEAREAPWPPVEDAFRDVQDAGAVPFRTTGEVQP